MITAVAKAFAPFLQTMRELDSAEEKRDTASNEGASASTEGASPSPPLPDEVARNATIIAILAQAGPISLMELQKRTGLDFAQFSEAVNSLRASGLIEVEGSSGEEVARVALELSALRQA